MSTAALEAHEVEALDEAQRVDAWRVEKFAELGFNQLQAERLADTRGDDGFPLYWGDVARLLQRGCDPAVAFDLVT